MSSYKEQVTAEHDAVCILSAVQSVVENHTDAGTAAALTIDSALEEAYGYLVEGMSNCRCMFANMAADRRLDLMNGFSDTALWSMAQGGYYNDSTGELLTATLEEVQEVHTARAERDAQWLAEQIAEEVSPALSDTYTDTFSVGLYTLSVNGKESEFAQFADRHALAYGVARELLKAGIDPENNTGIIAAVLEQADSGQSCSVIAGGLEFGPEFTVKFAGNS